MGKSAEAYYAEKLERLLQMQEAQKQKAQLSPPTRRSAPPQRTSDTDKPAAGADRAYYEGFRSRMQTSAARRQAEPRTNPSSSQKRTTSPQGVRAGQSGHSSSRQRPAGERQHKDVLSEEKKRMEAYRHASQGRRRRKVREALVSVALVFGVFVVLCVVIYQLLFVIRSLDVTGSGRYTVEEILDASGVDMGDHLYSFSSRVVQETIMLHCPYVAAVDVQRTPPGSIAFVVEEEEPVFYADFYGEMWEISRSLRMLDPISETDAKEQGLIKLKLPRIQEAVSGRKIVFSNTRSDTYIETVLDALQNSDLAGRVTMVDLRSAYDISMSCDGKYKLIFGDASVMETKLRLAVAVLEDTLFESDNKASVDLTDLSATSVIIDNQLDLE